MSRLFISRLFISRLQQILYTVIITVLLPFVIIKIAIRTIRDRDGHRKAGPGIRVLERFGFFFGVAPRGCVVFHAVSVGESLAAIGLIKRFIAANPNIPVCVTCSTQSASNIIRSRLGKKIFHCYLPYDHPLFLAPFLWRLRPRTFVFMENELWPNLIHTCHACGIELLLLNARLSEKSTKGYRRLRALISVTLNKFKQVYCQTEEDAARFLSLGLAKEKCKIVGNLKFDLEIPADVGRVAAAVKRDLLNGRPCWIGASTHEGEEEILLNAQRDLAARFADLVLILAPRRPERAGRVEALAANTGLRALRKSSGRALRGDQCVLIVDTLGELLPFYALSEACFVGGSLVDCGGHNPLEPAAFGKAVIAGDKVANFERIYHDLDCARALLLVKNQRDLTTHVTRLLSDRRLAAALGKQAQSYLQHHRGASRRSLYLLNRLIWAQEARGRRPRRLKLAKMHHYY